MLGPVESTDVLDLLDAFDEAGIHYWLDGGWGVDCLLLEQTRTHGDLDLVLPRWDLDHATRLLTSRGFAIIRDWLPTSLALRDAGGREVDLHPVDPTPDGGGHQLLPDGERWHYGAPVVGGILDRSVRCASAEDQLRMHQGYDPRPVDIQDVHRLAEHFRLPVPPPYDTLGAGAP